MTNRHGFSMVELIVALVILTFGVLALGAATGYVTLQVRMADLHTQRSAAVSQVAEQMRSMRFDNVQDVAYASRVTMNDYGLWRTVTNANNNLKIVNIFSEGPGYRPGSGWLRTVQDTFSISIVRP